MTARFRVFHPNLLSSLSWSGAGSGDGTVVADPYDETPYVESIRMPNPSWATYYGVVAPAAGTVYYVNGATGSDSNNGTATGTPFATFAKAYATIASSGDTIRMLAGAVPAGMPGGSIGEYNEGELGTLSKSFTLESYLGAHVVFDGRPAPYTSWTQEGGVARYYATHTSSHSPALDSGQGNTNSTSVTFANTSARYATRKECMLGFPVTKSGTMILPAAGQTVSTLTRSGTTATCVTTAAHGLSTGDSATIYAVDDGGSADSWDAYNGCHAVTVTNATTFTFTVTVSGVNPLTPCRAHSGSFYVASKYGVTGTNTYYHDSVNARLYVGFDPTSVVVRAATKRTFATFTGDVTVRGIVWRCYASKYGDSANDATLQFSTGTQTWTNCAVGFSAGEAWNGSGPSSGTARTVFRDCQAFWVRTGWSPLTNNTTVERCSGRYFNWFFGDTQGWHSGLVKAVGTTVKNVLVRGCHGEYSNGPVFWSDFCTTNMVYVHNRAKAGLKGGIFFEKNTATVGNESVVAGNLFEDCYWGLAMIGCRYLWMVNNTMWRASMEGRFFDDGRNPTHNVQGGTLVCKNNAFVAGTGSTMPGYSKVAVIQVNDGLGPDGINGSDWWELFDYNAVQIPSTVTSVTAHVPWENGNGTTNYATHAAWVAAMASQPRTPGAHHLSSTSTTMTTYLTNPTATPPVFTPTATLLAGGTTLNAAQLAALGPSYGLATTVSPGIGARFYPGRRG